MQIDLAPNPSLLAIMVIFILNYWMVRKFFLQPINGVLEARETETKTAEKLYGESLARLEEATAKTEAQLHGAKREAALLRDRFRAEASSYRQDVVDRTTAEARETVAAADRQLSSDVEVARGTIVRDSEQLARLAAERILGRAV